MHGQGGHGHNDALSFELSVGGRPVVVDPGSYIYTADAAARNAFRSTAAHSTLRVDGREQNDMTRNLFTLVDRSRAQALRVEKGRFVGRHDGFGMPCVRSFELGDGELRVIDVVEGSDDHLLEWALPLDPGCEAELDSGTVIICAGEWQVAVTSDRGSLSVADGWHSPRYGVRVPTRVIRGQRHGTGPTELRIRARQA
jgi:hypothetical protein